MSDGRSPARSPYTAQALPSVELVARIPSGEPEQGSPFYLLALVEGTGVRGALMSIIRASALSDRPDSSIEPYRQAAAEFLASMHAPARWIPSLATFLEQRTVPCVAEEEDFAELVRLHEGRARDALESGTYTCEVFDFCSGRVLPLSDLRPRQDVYADAVANASELGLDTRFTHLLDVHAECTESTLDALIRALSFVRRGQLRLVGLSNHGSQFLIEFECTVRQWLAVHETVGWLAEGEGAFTEELVADLHLRDSPAVILARVRELREVYTVERSSQPTEQS